MAPTLPEKEEPRPYSDTAAGGTTASSSAVGPGAGAGTSGAAPGGFGARARARGAAPPPPPVPALAQAREEQPRVPELAHAREKQPPPPGSRRSRRRVGSSPGAGGRLCPEPDGEPLPACPRRAGAWGAAAPRAGRWEAVLVLPAAGRGAGRICLSLERDDPPSADSPRMPPPCWRLSSACGLPGNSTDGRLEPLWILLTPWHLFLHRF
ncbi:hypothetical protein VULLAG_LOCUS6865 [Vulpes lagopus]